MESKQERLLDWAHTIMCNVDNGDPTRPNQSDEWRDAMRNWETEWLAGLARGEGERNG